MYPLRNLDTMLSNRHSVQDGDRLGCDMEK